MLNLKILALLLMMRKITLMVKFDKKYVHHFWIQLLVQVWVWRNGKVSGWDPRGQWLDPSLCCLVFFRQVASNVRLRLCDFSGGCTSRNGWSVKLRAIENCIFSIRSIERNMRPISRTEWLRDTRALDLCAMCLLSDYGRLSTNARYE